MIVKLRVVGLPLVVIFHIANVGKAKLLRAFERLQDVHGRPAVGPIKNLRLRVMPMLAIVGVEEIFWVKLLH